MEIILHASTAAVVCLPNLCAHYTVQISCAHKCPRGILLLLIFPCVLLRRGSIKDIELSYIDMHINISHTRHTD